MIKEAIANADLDQFYSLLPRYHSLLDASILKHAMRCSATLAQSRIMRRAFHRSVHILCVLCERFPRATFECVLDPYLPPVMGCLATFAATMHGKYPHYIHDAQIAEVLRHIPTHQATQANSVLLFAADWSMHRTVAALLEAHGARFPAGTMQTIARGNWQLAIRLADYAPGHGLDAANANQDALVHLCLDLHQIAVIDADPLTSDLYALRRPLRSHYPFVEVVQTLIRQVGIDPARTSFEGLTARDYLHRITIRLELVQALQPERDFARIRQAFEATEAALLAEELSIWRRRLRLILLSVKRPACPLCRLGRDVLRHIGEGLRPVTFH